MSPIRTVGSAALLLALLTLLPFLPASSNGFLRYDDDLYVTDNPVVRDGLTRAGVLWAFTTRYADNWHPLTWLSHMLDCELFGLDPRGHHAMSLTIHAAATALLFLALRSLTGSTARSALAAGLFGVHPLRVESVAWIAERKDVLAGLFCALTLLAYRRYARAPGVARYLAVAGTFACGLLSKPTLVALPIALLLLDAWPLGRWRGSAWPPRRLVLEKLPLLALSAGSAVSTLLAQSAGGATAPVGAIPWTARAANAAVACSVYLRKSIAPIDLSPFYPHPAVWSPGGFGAARLASGAAAAALLIAITYLALRLRSTHPFFAVGWLWFLGMLVPMLGLVQVGMQAYADRYTYLPSIGLSVAVVWGLEAVAGVLRPRWLVIAGAIAVLAVLATGSWIQSTYWHDDVTLWSRALRVDPSNALAHSNLGSALLIRGSSAEAFGQFEQALQAKPNFEEALSGKGTALVRQGRYAEAVAPLEHALRLAPRDGHALTSLGAALLRLGDRAGAVARFERAAQFAPSLPEARNALGVVRMEDGRLEESARELEAAIALRSAYPEAHANLGKVLRALGRRVESETHLREALRLRPDYPAALTELGLLLVEGGRGKEAEGYLVRAVALSPGDARAREALEEIRRRSGG